MIKNKRDDSLDIIKGLCCILMVVAHEPFFFTDLRTSLGVIDFVTALVPVPLFFGIAGVTATFQLPRYSFRSLVLYFVAMFVIGTSWNVFMHGDITSFKWPEIFQIIALGSLFVCVVERTGPVPQPILFSIALGFILIKQVVDAWWPHLSLWNFLFCDPNYTLTLGRSKILPGFPVFPWAGYFFLGVWSYRARKNTKLVLSLVALGVAALSAWLGSNIAEKWDTTMAYSAALCVTVFSFFWLFHDPVETRSWLTEQLRRIGSNAFLFFYSHPLGLLAGGVVYFMTHSAFLGWAVGIAVSVLTYNLVSRVKPAALFKSGYAWLVLMGIVVVLPFLPSVFSHDKTDMLMRLCALLIGAITALNFASLSRVVKKSKTPVAAAQVSGKELVGAP